MSATEYNAVDEKPSVLLILEVDGPDGREGEREKSNNGTLASDMSSKVPALSGTRRTSAVTGCFQRSRIKNNRGSDCQLSAEIHGCSTCAMMSCKYILNL